MLGHRGHRCHHLGRASAARSGHHGQPRPLHDRGGRQRLRPGWHRRRSHRHRLRDQEPLDSRRERLGADRLPRPRHPRRSRHARWRRSAFSRRGGQRLHAPPGLRRPPGAGLPRRDRYRPRQRRDRPQLRRHLLTPVRQL